MRATALPVNPDPILVPRTRHADVRGAPGVSSTAGGTTLAALLIGATSSAARTRLAYAVTALSASAIGAMPDGVAGLVAVIRDPRLPTGLRGAALTLFEGVDQPRCVSDAVALLREDRLQDPSGLRCAAVRALAAASEHDLDAVVPLLCGLLRHFDPNARAEAVVTLGALMRVVSTDTVYWLAPLLVRAAETVPEPQSLWLALAAEPRSVSLPVVQAALVVAAERDLVLACALVPALAGAPALVGDLLTSWVAGPDGGLLRLLTVAERVPVAGIPRTTLDPLVQHPNPAIRTAAARLRAFSAPSVRTEACG
jgi:hypothetical protein